MAFWVPYEKIFLSQFKRQKNHLQQHKKWSISPNFIIHQSKFQFPCLLDLQIPLLPLSTSHYFPYVRSTLRIVCVVSKILRRTGTTESGKDRGKQQKLLVAALAPVLLLLLCRVPSSRLSPRRVCLLSSRREFPCAAALLYTHSLTNTFRTLIFDCLERAKTGIDSFKIRRNRGVAVPDPEERREERQPAARVIMAHGPAFIHNQHSAAASDT